MKINKQTIEKLKPCNDRFQNFVTEYPDFNGHVTEFLSLDRISYDDKIWVCSRILPVNTLVKWSVLCAESVLEIYELRHPGDRRIRDCLEYLGTISDFTTLTRDQRSKINRHGSAAAAAVDAAAYAAAHAACAAVYASDAVDASRAAVDAVADAAFAASRAAAAASRAAAYSAADASYASAYVSDAATHEQRDVNIILLQSLTEDL